MQICSPNADNGLWYGVVRDYEAISYQFTPNFFTSHKRSKTSETRMHYTMCVCPVWASGIEDAKLFQRVKVTCARELVSRSISESQARLL